MHAAEIRAHHTAFEYLERFAIGSKRIGRADLPGYLPVQSPPAHTAAGPSAARIA